jgi:phosphoribosylglycinamide formyltransferase-1
MTATGRVRRIAVAASGSGRTLANLLQVQESYNFEVAAVIVSRPDCGAVGIATDHNLPLLAETFTPAELPRLVPVVYGWLKEHDIDLVALGGFLKRWPTTPLWAGRVVNIHPALLPKHGGAGMYGDRVHAAVIAAGDSESGATIHFVDDRYDEGRPIAQIRVPVLPNDDPKTLAARVFAAECSLYPYVLDRLATGALPLPGGRIESLQHAAD